MAKTQSLIALEQWTCYRENAQGVKLHYKIGNCLPLILID